MIKIMLKNPVIISYDQTEQLADKLGLFLKIQGVLDEQFVEKLGGTERWYKGVNDAGNTVLIPIENVAYFEEIPDVG